MQFKNTFWRVTSILTLVFYMTGDLTSGYAAISQTPLREISVKSNFSFHIPADYGRIDTIHASSQPQARTIIHIQEAHGSPTAQKSIEHILLYLNKQYGPHLILLEGNAGQLHPELLKFEKKSQKRIRNLLYELAQQSLVTGPELYFSRKRGTAYGIEDPETYLENGGHYAEVLRQKQETEGFLETLNMQITRLASPYLSSELRQFLERIDNFNKGAVPFLNHIEELKNFAKRHLEKDLGNAWYQLDWPMLVRFFTLQKLEKALDIASYQSERENFLTQLKALEISTAEIESFLTENPSSDPAPSAANVFENLVAQLPETFDYASYPNINRFIGHLILRSELDGAALFREIEKMTAMIEEHLSPGENEKQIMHILRKYRLLKKLFALELSAAEFETLSKTEKIRPSDLLEKLESINLEKRVKNLEEDKLSVAALKDLDLLYDSAVRFYGLARRRDSQMIANVEKRMEETKARAAIVITGGFHSGPFETHFQEKQDHYVRITPKLNPEEGSKRYTELMLAGFSPKANASTLRLTEALIGNPTPVRDRMREQIATYAAAQRDTPREFLDRFAGVQSRAELRQAAAASRSAIEEEYAAAKEQYDTLETRVNELIALIGSEDPAADWDLAQVRTELAELKRRAVGGELKGRELGALLQESLAAGTAQTDENDPLLYMPEARSPFYLPAVQRPPDQAAELILQDLFVEKQGEARRAQLVERNKYGSNLRFLEDIWTRSREPGSNYLYQMTRVGGNEVRNYDWVLRVYRASRFMENPNDPRDAAIIDLRSRIQELQGDFSSMGSNVKMGEWTALLNDLERSSRRILQREIDFAPAELSEHHPDKQALELENFGRLDWVLDIGTQMASSEHLILGYLGAIDINQRIEAYETWRRTYGPDPEAEQIIPEVRRFLEDLRSLAEKSEPVYRQLLFTGLQMAQTVLAGLKYTEIVRRDPPRTFALSDRGTAKAEGFILKYSPDGQSAVFLKKGYDYFEHINLETGKVTLYQIPPDPDFSMISIMDVAVSPDGKRAAVLRREVDFLLSHNLYVLNLADGTYDWVLSAPPAEGIEQVAWSSNGNRIFYFESRARREISIDYPSGEVDQQETSRHALVYSRNGRYAASLSGDGLTMEVRNLERLPGTPGYVIRTYLGGQNNGVTISDNGNYVAVDSRPSPSQTREITLWQYQGDGYDYSDNLFYRSPTAGITRFSSDGKYMVMSLHGILNFYNTGTRQNASLTMEDEIQNFDISLDDQSILIYDGQGRLTRHDFDELRRQARPEMRMRSGSRFREVYSNDLERLLRERMPRLYRAPEAERSIGILDFATGSGEVLPPLKAYVESAGFKAENITLYGIEINDLYARYAQTQGYPVLQGDVSKPAELHKKYPDQLPEGRQFDVIIMNAPDFQRIDFAAWLESANHFLKADGIVLLRLFTYMKDRPAEKRRRQVREKAKNLMPILENNPHFKMTKHYVFDDTPKLPMGYHKVGPVILLQKKLHASAKTIADTAEKRGAAAVKQALGLTADASRPGRAEMRASLESLEKNYKEARARYQKLNKDLAKINASIERKEAKAGFDLEETMKVLKALRLAADGEEHRAGERLEMLRDSIQEQFDYDEKTDPKLYVVRYPEQGLRPLSYHENLAGRIFEKKPEPEAAGAILVELLASHAPNQERQPDLQAAYKKTDIETLRKFFEEFENDETSLRKIVKRQGRSLPVYQWVLQIYRETRLRAAVKDNQEAEAWLKHRLKLAELEFLVGELYRRIEAAEWQALLNDFESQANRLLEKEIKFEETPVFDYKLEPWNAEGADLEGLTIEQQRVQIGQWLSQWLGIEVTVGPQYDEDIGRIAALYDSAASPWFRLGNRQERSPLLRTLGKKILEEMNFDPLDWVRDIGRGLEPAEPVLAGYLEARRIREFYAAYQPAQADERTVQIFMAVRDLLSSLQSFAERNPSQLQEKLFKGLQRARQALSSISQDQGPTSRKYSLHHAGGIRVGPNTILKYSRDGNSAVVSEVGRSYFEWINLQSGEVRNYPRPAPAALPPGQKRSRDTSIIDLEISPDGSHVAILTGWVAKYHDGSANASEVHILDLKRERYELLYTYGDGSSIDRIAWHASGEYLLYSNPIRKQYVRIEYPSGENEPAAAVPQRWTDNGRFSLILLNNRVAVRELNGDTPPILTRGAYQAVELSESGELLVTVKAGSQSYEVTLRERDGNRYRETGKFKYTGPENKFLKPAVHISADGNYVVISNGERELNFYDVRTQSRASLDFETQIRSFDMSPDGAYVLIYDETGNLTRHSFQELLSQARPEVRKKEELQAGESPEYGMEALETVAEEYTEHVVPLTGLRYGSENFRKLVVKITGRFKPADLENFLEDLPADIQAQIPTLMALSKSMGRAQAKGEILHDLSVELTVQESSLEAIYTSAYLAAALGLDYKVYGMGKTKDARRFLRKLDSIASRRGNRFVPSQSPRFSVTAVEGPESITKIFGAELNSKVPTVSITGDENVLLPVQFNHGRVLVKDPLNRYAIGGIAAALLDEIVQRYLQLHDEKALAENDYAETLFKELRVLQAFLTAA